jgi:chromosomal replication initiator protein
MIENNLKEMWNKCLQVIKDNVPPQSYDTWFVPIEPIKYENNNLFIQVPTQFFY